MYGLPEKEFVINGVKSWIHCLHRVLDSKAYPPKVSYHYHSYIEILYSLSSDATLWINGECYKFTAGDLAIINSGELHDVVINNKSDYICIKFSPHVLYADEQALLEFKYVTPFILGNDDKKIYSKEEIQNIDVSSLVKEIMKEWDEKKTAYELVIRANILRIFSEILRIRSNTPMSEIVLSESMKRAAAYIHENYSTAGEKEVARLCKMSYNHFSYVFKKTFKKSFSEYVTRVKLREAEKMLILTDKSITEIAYDAGFSTSSHFIMRFKEAKGITPNKFRKQFGSVTSDA